MKLITALSCLAVSAVAQADDISYLDTGAGLYSANNGAVLVDPNWSVSLLSSIGTPPGGIPTGAAYVVPNNQGWPFPISWIPNDSTSTWISYSTPLQIGGDTTSDLFQYQTSFTAASSGVDYVRWLSDNSSTFLLNNVVIPRPNPYDLAWNAWVPFDLTAGELYTVDFDVYNVPQATGNPTGLRVEFTTNPPAAPVTVPDAGSPFIYIVFALLAGVQAMCRLRKIPAVCHQSLGRLL
jgi:hypothetical protein